MFADAIAARSGELDVWLTPEGDDPPRPLSDYDAVMAFGGAMHADQEAAHPWLAREKALLRELLQRGIPLLGVCLGSQLVSEAAGGTPRPAPQPEIGWFEVELTPEGTADPVTGALAPSFEAFEWHSYELGLPDEATLLARSALCAQAYRLGELAWGIQFHAEVSSASVASWLDRYDADREAVRTDLDPAALRAQTAERLESWNELGHGLCDRFLAVAEG